MFIQTTIQYLRKKAPQLLQKDDFNAKNIANIETIHILLSVLQLALPSLTNGDLIQEIQTMIVTAKHLNSTRPPQSKRNRSTIDDRRRKERKENLFLSRPSRRRFVFSFLI